MSTLHLLQSIAATREPRVLCTILEVKGSAPRHAGAMLLAGPEGLVEGSVGGGRGEGLALAACREHLGGGPPVLLDIAMQGTEAEGPAMLCGGSSRILVEPLAARAPYAAALERLERGERVLLVKRPATGETWVLAGGGWVQGDLNGVDQELAQRALDSGRPLLAGDLFFHPLLPRDRLLILGGGHVGRALAAIAPALGFTVTVGDEREGFLEPARFPEGVATRPGSFTAIVEAFPFDPATYVVIATRSHTCDLECVRAALSRPCRYLGFMGSRRKTRLILDQLLADGFEPGRVAALRAPIGLDLGAETPEELAVAIAAELIAVRSIPDAPILRVLAAWRGAP